MRESASLFRRYNLQKQKNNQLKIIRKKCGEKFTCFFHRTFRIKKAE